MYCVHVLAETTLQWGAHATTTTTTATIGFMSKTTTMQVHNILPSQHDNDLRSPYATFCEKHEHLPTNLPFSFFALNAVFSVQLQQKLP